MDAFTAGFGDELIKTAKYPISRMLSAPHLPGAIHGASGAASGSILGPVGAALGGVAGLISGAVAPQRMRLGGIRGLKARVAQGGGSLMKHEKRKLAEAAGISVPQLEKALARIGKKAKHTGDLANMERAATYKYNPLGVIPRAIGVRGLAGRATRKGGAALMREEKELLDLIKKKNPGLMKKILAGGAVTGAGLAGGKAIADR